MDESLQQRGKALEDQFFHERDKKLLEKLRADMELKEARQSLASITGISDEKVIDHLVQHKINAESLLSLTMVPLVTIAWADNHLEQSERAAVLRAAHHNGIEEGTVAHQLLESWLNTKPGADLLNAWKEYVRALKTKLAAEPFAQMRDKILQNAKAVAESAGGFMGIIGRVSAAEKAIIQDLEATFN